MEPSVSCPSNIVEAYSKGTYSDLRITCGPLTFNVHRLVVCSSCDFFKKSLEFTVGREAEEQCIDLPEDDPDMITRLITYLYIGDYEPCKSTSLAKYWQLKRSEHAPALSASPHPYVVLKDECACLIRIRDFHLPQDNNKEQTPNQVKTPLSIHADMYALGDKYQVVGLCSLAASKFSASLPHHWNSTDFITAVQTVYSSTPDSKRGLRDIVVQAFRDYFGTDVKKDPCIEAKLHTIDELSFALLKSWPNKVKASGTPVKSTSPQVTNVASSASGFQFSTFGGNSQTGSSFASLTGDNRPGGGLFGGITGVPQQSAPPRQTPSLFGAPR